LPATERHPLTGIKYARLIDEDHALIHPHNEDTHRTQIVVRFRYANMRVRYAAACFGYASAHFGYADARLRYATA
jgi:hypothetical protein